MSDFLTKEEVAELTKIQAEARLQLLEKNYPLDKPFAKMDEQKFKALWAQVDDIANTLLYLEDHISRCDMLVRVANAGSHRWDNANKEEV